MIDKQLRIRVLGRAELTVDGRPLAELASVKAAALLCFLAVTGTAHPRTALAGLLWSDLPEPAARANLRLVLTKLRRVVPGRLRISRQTVAPDGPPIWVDALEVARVAASADDGELLTAVRLCRGEFLDGFEVPGAPVFDEWVAGRRAAARADMLAVMDRAVRRARDGGDAAGGVEVARRMLELGPLDEEAHRALMWFLALDGRRSAALAQYDTCRYLLREEVGAEPSAATAALRDEIAGAASFTAGTAGVPDLPRPLTTLIGRDEELRRLRELLADPACRLVTLVGPGGVGKTRLAVEAAAQRPDRHRDGAVFVSFAGTGPAGADRAGDLVVTDLARAFGLSLAVPRDPLDVLAGHLADRELLLVLDNLEHLRGAGGVLVELLRRAPGVTVLATSRRQLGLGAEWLVEVRGLACPPPGADAAGYDAVRLFVERARLLRPGLTTAEATEAAGRLCRLVAGMPLAIELAARWMRSAGPAAIADRLAAGLDLLATTASDVEPRHRSMRTVIDWSCRLLTDEEAGALRRFSVLRRGFDLAAAEAVAGAGLAVLAGLVDQSLVAVGDDGRYELHELLRQYAAERLAADPEEEAETLRRHARHYAALLAAGGESWPEADAENLRAATELLVRTADPATLDAHLGLVWALYGRMGWFREVRACFAAAVDRPGTPALLRARWERVLGEAHQQLGEAGAARHHLERALERLGSRAPRTTAGRLATLAARVGRRLLPGRAALRGERRDEVRERAAAYFTIIEAYWVLGERLPMLPAALGALDEAERAGDPDLTARARAGLGMLLGVGGLHPLARRQLRAARAAADRAGDPLTTCWVGIVGGLYWTGVGAWADVEAGAARALALRDRTPLHRWADEVLLIAAAARYLTARDPETVAAAAEGLASGRDRQDVVVQLWGLLLLIETAVRADPADPALPEHLRAAAGLLPDTAGVDAARYRVAAARVHLAAGRRAEAWQAAVAADRLVGPRPSFAQYALEAHAGVVEVCLALLEQPAAEGGPDPAGVRATAAGALRRLRRYARAFPMARPRALVCLGRARWLAGRRRAATRVWVRAVREAERRRMPYELARAHHELARHLAEGRRSPLGLDRAAHLDRARAAFSCP
ncbi:BTAD domain-containing putative transcriptional regulator [Dactylosporangium sp. AC04546]|uniref:ATP-binding protein n=1 Tax=Dactylosporangium sp. AC04546 TaxID=2862460 RepID=UPI001EE0EE3E|nr:BTAD domain-containing putative transcriptional regulator [Dactylosporangium sp. AC04546]WVK89303.1 BTAD domain-containing putative transcriptional regulator [Dactylosporangium sp. AC04546]